MRTNDHGEWTVIDLVRDYRLCSFNDAHHGGAHLHWPIAGPARLRVPVRDLDEAKELVDWFAAQGRPFALARFEAEVSRWRSASSRT